MSQIAMREVWKLDLPPTEKFVLLAIADFSDDKKGIAWPSQSTIARKTGYSRQTVNRAINRLREKKMIASSRRSAKGKSTSNENRITIATINDIHANNVTHNNNQVSNSGTNRCNGELHKPLLTLNEPLNENIDVTLSNGKKNQCHLWTTKNTRRFPMPFLLHEKHYALNNPALMRNLRSQGLVWETLNTKS